MLSYIVINTSKNRNNETVTNEIYENINLICSRTWLLSISNRIMGQNSDVWYHKGQQLINDISETKSTSTTLQSRLNMSHHTENI